MLYQTLKLVHVLAVVAWVGGLIMMVLMAGRAARTGTAALAPVARLAADLGGYIAAVAGVAFLAGVGMMFTEGAPGWGEAWISIGLTVFLITAFTGSRLEQPRYAALADAADGGDAAAVEGARKALLPVAMLDLTLLVIAIAAMVYRWGA